MARCPAAHKIYMHLYHIKNVVRERELASLYRQKNIDKLREVDRKRREAGYWKRPEVKAAMLKRSMEWAASNRDKVLAASEKYRVANKAKYAVYASNRRCRKLKATPKWLTEEDHEKIRSFYEEAARLTRETGVRYEVDHIVPLRGYTVCGLHVPSNLRVIPMLENRHKPRVWREAATG